MHQYKINGVARALLATLTLFALAFGMFGFSLTSPSIANADMDQDQVCNTITLNSGTTTLTAGYTEVNPSSAVLALQPGTYSRGSFMNASTTQTVIPPWIDPAVNSNFASSSASSSAMWVSSDPTWAGGTNNTEGSPLNNQWRLFQDSFTLPAGATVTNATLWYTADNAAAVYLNGSNTAIATTNGTTSEDVYGTSFASSTQNFGQVFTTSFSPVVGTNTLNFVVRNWSMASSTASSTNPTGLLYKGVVNYCMPGENTHPMVTVTINKYIDGAPATASSSANKSFPISATWNSSSTGSGSGTFNLSSTGYNSSNPYEAITAQMTKGASYSLHEVTGGDAVGLTCGTSSQPYTNVGYTTGNSKAEARVKTPTTTPPSFTNMTHNMYVIIWNHACAGTTGGLGGEVVDSEGLHVDSVDAIKVTATADNSYENGWKYVFHITTPTNEPRLAMKFGDWFNSTASSTIAAGGNMRISSAQASSTSPITITSANTYSSPFLNMVTDLDSSRAGRQVDVTVEVKIPVGSANGTYTTTYGVQTLP